MRLLKSLKSWSPGPKKDGDTRSSLSPDLRKPRKHQRASDPSPEASRLVHCFRHLELQERHADRVQPYSAPPHHCHRTQATTSSTDVFRAMHPDPDIVRLYLKPLLIGELAPEEPNQERNKNSQLVEDFQELRRTLETLNMFNANLGFFFLHLAQVLILEALAWVIVWHFGSGWLITIFISFLLTVAQAQGSFLQHDTGHLCIFKKPKWNRLMQKFVMSHLKYGKNKIKFINYEKQHLYFHVSWVPFLIPVYFNLDSILAMYRRRDWEDIAWVSTFYIRHFITFGPFYGIFGTMVLIYLVKYKRSAKMKNKQPPHDWNL